MRPEAVQLIVDVIGEVNRKTLYEREQKGCEEGRANAMEEIAVKLKDVLSVEEIADRTGLTVDRVKELI